MVNMTLSAQSSPEPIAEAAASAEPSAQLAVTGVEYAVVQVVPALANAMMLTTEALRIRIASGTGQSCSTPHRAIGALRSFCDKSERSRAALKELTLLNHAYAALHHFDVPRLSRLSCMVEQLLSSEQAESTEQPDVACSIDPESINLSSNLVAASGLAVCDSNIPESYPSCAVDLDFWHAKISFLETKIEALLAPQEPALVGDHAVQCNGVNVASIAVGTLRGTTGDKAVQCDGVVARAVVGAGVNTSGVVARNVVDAEINRTLHLKASGKRPRWSDLADHSTTCVDAKNCANPQNSMRLADEAVILRSMSQSVNGMDYCAQRLQALAAAQADKALREQYHMAVTFFKGQGGCLAPGPDVLKRVERYQAEIRSVGRRGIWKPCS